MSESLLSFYPSRAEASDDFASNRWSPTLIFQSGTTWPIWDEWCRRRNRWAGWRRATQSSYGPRDTGCGVCCFRERGRPRVSLRWPQGLGWRTCSSSTRHPGSLRFVYLRPLRYNFRIAIGAVASEAFVGRMCVSCSMHWGCSPVICERLRLFRSGFWGDAATHVFVWWLSSLIRGYACDTECDWLLLASAALGVSLASSTALAFFTSIWLASNLWLQIPFLFRFFHFFF